MMKKFICTAAALGLVSTLPAQCDYLYETIVIPSIPREVFIQQTNVLPQDIEKELQPDEITGPKYAYNNITYPIVAMLGKFKNEIKVIYTDIDGILTSDGETDIDENIYTTFSKLEKNKLPVIFTTGRTFIEAKKVANELNLNPDYYITQNGAEITNAEGEIIYEEPLLHETVKKINHEVKWFNMIYKQSVSVVFYINGLAYAYNGCPAEILDKPVYINKFSQLPIDMASKIEIYSDKPRTLEMFKKYLQHNYPYLNIISVSPKSFDINAEFATKANAVEALSQKTGINLMNSAAFGLKETDVSLMDLIRQNGGLAISAEDSVQEVKRRTSYITKEQELDGFSFAVDVILGNNFSLKAGDED